MPGLRNFPRFKSLSTPDRGSTPSSAGGGLPQKSPSASPAAKDRALDLPAGGLRGLLQKSRQSTPSGGRGSRGTPSPIAIPGDVAAIAGAETANSSPSTSGVSTGAWVKQRASERGSLPRAFERAKQAEEKLQQKKDLQVAAEWNECFKSAANRRDPEKLAHFWTELKGRLIKKFGNLTAAFGNIKSDREESLSFLNFSDMLRLIYLPLDQRISRLLFEIASGGDHKLLFHDLKLALMERNIQRLRNALVLHHEKKERINFHVQSFLGRLTKADANVCTNSVDRFQRKLTVPLCRKLWKALLDTVGASGTREVSVIRSIFERVVRDELAGKFLQTYELAYMMRIFDRVDTNAGYKPGTGHVQLLSLICALLLMSPEPDRCLKVSLLFEAYDSDEDGCVLYGQILAMLQCICAQKPLADENLRGAKDWTFQEELALQEGLRFYERTRWCLQRECRVEGEVVAVRELWDALQRQQQVLEEILPSMVKMHWLAQPSMQEQIATQFGENDAAADVNRRLSSASIDPITGFTRPRRASVKGVPKQFLAAAGGGGAGGGGRRHQALQQAIQVSLAERDERKGLESVPHLAQLDPVPPPPMSVTFSPPALVEDTPPVPPESPASLRQTPTFKESLAGGFKQSLRALSEQRMNELSGFSQRVDLNGESQQSANIARARTPQASRNRPLVLSDVSRPVSAASETNAKRNMQRNHSAPADVALTKGSPAASRGIAVGNIDCERWGVSSTERFRLFSTLKSTFARAQMAGDRSTQPGPEDGIGYHCFLCHSFHTLNAACST